MRTKTVWGHGRSRAVGIGALIAVVGLGAVAGPVGAWGSTVRVSEAFARGILSDNDGVAVGSDAVHSIFYSEDYGQFADVSVGYSPSGLAHDESGRTLDERCETAEGIAADGDRVVAVCSRAGFSHRLLVLYRIKDGRWGAGVALHGSTRPSDNSASVAMFGKLVVVAWTDERTGGIVLRRSTDGGATFKAPVTLGSATMLGTRYEGRQRNGRVQVAVRGQRVHVVWHPGSKRTSKGLRPSGIRLRRSTDGGRTFRAAQSLSMATQWPGPPSLVTTDAGALILHTTGEGQVRLLRSTDQGGTFTSAAMTGDKGAHGQVDLAASGSEVRAIWRKGTAVYLRRSANGGATWAPREDTGVERREDITIEPNVVLFRGETAVAWSAADPAWEDLGGAWVSITSTP